MKEIDRVVLCQIDGAKKPSEYTFRSTNDGVTWYFKTEAEIFYDRSLECGDCFKVLEDPEIFLLEKLPPVEISSAKLILREPKDFDL